MAYPEPIPALRGRHAREFLKRLEGFKLTTRQRRIYSDAVEYYNRIRPGADE